MSLPWTIKHRPSSPSGFVDNEEAFTALRRWLLSWRAGAPEKRAAMLYGPPGVGKTLSVSLLATELGFDLVEMNASDYRTREAVERVAGMAATEASLYGRGKIILLDELEGMSVGEDSGGIAAIASLIRKTLSPIVLIASNAWDQRFIAFREGCLLVEFKRIPLRSIILRLREICLLEGVSAEEEALRVIAERARGDLRSAITDLQAFSQGSPSLTYRDVRWLDMRDRQEPIFEVLKSIFNAENCQRARRALAASDVDYEMLFEWVYENLPHQVPDKVELARSLEALSRADIFLTRVKRLQEWGLLPYALDNMSAGVAMVRTKRPQGWVPFRFPQRIRAMSYSKAQRSTRDGLGRKIAGRCHVSVETAVREYVPYLRVIFSVNKSLAKGIAAWLSLSDEEAAYLASS